MGKSDELRAKLDEQGIEWKSQIDCDTYWYGQDETFYKFTEYNDGTTSFTTCQWNLTPKQVLTTPIAATVGVDSNTGEDIRKLLDKLSTELCNAGCVVECETREERQRLIDAVKDKYAQSIAATVGERNPDGLPIGLTVSSDGNLLNWVGENYVRQDAATGNRSCASCPEMDNPDSYISHIHAALEWHDEHVPRPTHPMSTCVVLEGEKVPEEVLFIGANGVTHYLPEATCRNKGFKDEGDYTCKNVSGKWWEFKCSRCGFEVDESPDDLCTMCPCCGATIVEEDE